MNIYVQGDISGPVHWDGTVEVYFYCGKAGGVWWRISVIIKFSSPSMTWACWIWVFNGCNDATYFKYVNFFSSWYYVGVWKYIYLLPWVFLIRFFGTVALNHSPVPYQIFVCWELWWGDGIWGSCLILWRWLCWWIVVIYYFVLRLFLWCLLRLMWLCWGLWVGCCCRLIKLLVELLYIFFYLFHICAWTVRSASWCFLHVIFPCFFPLYIRASILSVILVLWPGL